MALTHRMFHGCLYPETSLAWGLGIASSSSMVISYPRIVYCLGFDTIPPRRPPGKRQKGRFDTSFGQANSKVLQ